MALRVLWGLRLAPGQLLRWRLLFTCLGSGTLPPGTFLLRRRLTEPLKEGCFLLLDLGAASLRLTTPRANSLSSKRLIR